METVLFKAKRTDGSGWIEGDLTQNLDQNRFAVTPQDSTDKNLNDFEINFETLCQFTGFTYKDQKVFQGDTFKIKLEDSVEPEGFYWWEVEVKQHLGCWILAQIGHDYKGTPIEQCELLFTTDYELVPTGNIHDKPQPNEN